ncbi:MAG: hypothetical protein H6621_10830 [Halobacteriovoraceae bacterium]|nr:hypothetical protein [Halobacteriovoraceae bacterium]MCB9095552.1 hypothetical protein [Halobacteriovoraceae bacterium]
MGAKCPFFIQYLKEELDQRKLRNSNYSHRAFSQWLEVDPSFLSKVFSRQRVFSLKVADSIIRKLNPDDSEMREKFLTSVSEEMRCHSLNKYDTELTDCPGTH